jgi:Flp pilus assembly protein TadB
MTFQNAFASPAGWAKARATARRIKIREQVAKEKAKAKAKAKTKAPPKRQQSKPKSMTEISRLLKNPKPLSRPDAVHKKYANILK